MTQQMSQSSRVVAVLSDGLWHSIQDIHLQAGTMRLNSRVAELRSRGYDIACDKTGGRYAYKLLSKPAPQGPQGEKALAISNAVTGGSSPGELEGRNPSAWGFRPSSPSGSTSGGADGLTAVPAGHTAGASAPPEDAAAGDIPSTSPALAAAQPSLFDMPKVAPWA